MSDLYEIFFMGCVIICDTCKFILKKALLLILKKCILKLTVEQSHFFKVVDLNDMVYKRLLYRVYFATTPLSQVLQREH